MIGSMDGVHLAWSKPKAPSQQMWMYKGKKEYPTLALNVTVHCTHDLRISYIAPVDY